MVHVYHELPPVYRPDSKILILGSLPSVKSREEGFYYAHPRNRFWKLLGTIYGEERYTTVKEKTEMLKKHHTALWDVIESCDIKGSSDASIKNAKPNDIYSVIKKTNIERIYINGSKAYELYMRYVICGKKDEIRHIDVKHDDINCETDHNCSEKVMELKKIPVVKLPSTSPANATWDFERLLEAWKVIRS